MTEDEGLRERKKRLTWQAIHDAAFGAVELEGLDQATVQQICDEAGVSPRTFFNYFASKGAAALGISKFEVSARTRDAFLESRGDLLTDVCRLVAATVPLPNDRLRVKELVRAHPELSQSLWQEIGSVRQTLLGLVEQRAADEEQARLTLTLVLSALGETMRSGRHVETREELGQMLEATIGRIGRIVFGAAATPRV